MDFDPKETRKLFEGRLESLENDAKRAYEPISHLDAGEIIRPAPFPIAMYAFAIIDFFSSCWAGWNQRRPSDGTRDQTVRMIEFLKKYLKYPCKESLVAIQIWRHKLMHTSEPRPLKDLTSGERYNWAMYGDPQGIAEDLHWTLKKYEDDITMSIGFFNLVTDLRTGILGDDGYFEELCASPELQCKFREFQRELDNYSLDWSKLSLVGMIRIF